MPPDSLETVRRLYGERWAPGRLDLIPEVLHPEIVWTAIESAPDAGVRRGHGESRRYMADWLEDFELESGPIELLGTTADGRLVCSLEATGTGKGSGATTEIRYAAAFRVAEDGRIIEIHQYESADAAREDTGLSP